MLTFYTVANFPQHPFPILDAGPRQTIHYGGDITANFVPNFISSKLGSATLLVATVTCFISD